MKLIFLTGMIKCTINKDEDIKLTIHLFDIITRLVMSSFVLKTAHI